MDGTGLTQVGEQLFVVKLLLTSVQGLWIYNYIITLGDEIKYAWSGRKSWVFALFIANRYAPLVHLIWVQFTMFKYNKPFCQGSKWMPILHSCTVTILAQTTVALRIYAITRKNKLLGGALAIIIAIELCSGTFSVIWVALGELQQLPEIHLDAFEICIYKRWRLGELLYYNLAMFFDFSAFSIIVFTARRSRMIGYSGRASILDIILRDATKYFVIIFSAHLLSTLFLFVAPENLQLMPGITNSVFVPVMASRLMLSLKKAAVGPSVVWSIETMTSLSLGVQAEDRIIRFAPHVSIEPCGTSLTSKGLNEEDIELNAGPGCL